MKNRLDLNKKPIFLAADFATEEVKNPCFYYICMSEAINFYGRLTFQIATLAIGFNPKGMKPSDITYNINIVIIKINFLLDHFDANL